MATEKSPKKQKCYKHKIDEAICELEEINKEALSIADKLGVSKKELEDARSEHKREISLVRGKTRIR